MSQLEVHREFEGDVTIVSFGGEFDYAEMGTAQEELRAAEELAPKVLLLDLTGLAFMDSSAVRVILQADRRAREQGRRLALLTGTGPPHRVLSILGLVTRLDIVADREAVTGS
ncbi:MAG TPA: STAS domain-containing protein [Pseudonocardiaceae bacterium]